MNDITIDLDTQIRTHWNKAAEHATLAVEEAWLCGQALARKRDSLPHGEFLPWLDAEGFSRSRAYRFLKLAENLKLPTLGSFESVSGALASLDEPRHLREARAEANATVDAMVAKARAEGSDPLTVEAGRVDFVNAMLEVAAERGENPTGLECDTVQDFGVERTVRLLTAVDHARERHAEVLESWLEEIDAIRAEGGDVTMAEEQLVAILSDMPDSPLSGLRWLYDEADIMVTMEWMAHHGMPCTYVWEAGQRAA